MSPIPQPTPVYRLMHMDNLDACLRRGGLYAPNHVPQDGLPYRTIHNLDIQEVRRARRIPCGSGGVIHDYVGFYFGFLSPMLFQLKTGWVQGYNEGQEPLLYLVSTAQTLDSVGGRFVFSDGHGVAAFTGWYDRLADLYKVDWDMVYERYWSDNTDDMDRQRRKQAEFLVYLFCPWPAILEIAVINDRIKASVQSILNGHPRTWHPPIRVRPEWYY